LKWASLVNAVGPFTLQNAYLIDPNTHVVVDEITTIALKTDSNLNSILTRPNLKNVQTITQEMRQGAYPKGFLDKLDAADTGKIILVHGYCASVNPFGKYPEDWTNAEFFLNANANIGTDEFSAMVDTYANNNGINSYSVVGHSQGGMVGLHIYNFYFSAMDITMEKLKLRSSADATRLVQAVGTPFQGCTGAGSAANLAKLFGAGCGDNYDLTTDGAQIWLSGISAEARTKIYYYTTTYQLGNWFGDYCNLAVNAVLEWPNDGTTETVFTKLSGATNLGNTEKQCHTTDMSYPAQYHDRNRNRQMNANAAR